MSYDLRVWTVRRPDIGQLATDPQSPPEDQVRLVGRTWQIVVTDPVTVEGEDVPVEVDEALPGIGFLTELNLEPIGAPSQAHTALRRIAKRIAAEAHGVIEDPQQDTLQFGAAVKRFTPLGQDEDAALCVLSWWFIEGAMTEPTGVRGLCKILERRLPEALPWRYGLYEPPQHRWDREGKDHFYQFFQEHGRSLVVWYPRPPIAHVHVSLPSSLGPSTQGFRSAHLTMEVDAAALWQPGWETAVRATWRSLSEFVQPFYGDIRFLRHYSRSRGRYWSNASSEHHPIRSWWWAGLPGGTTYGIVLGPPYTSIWSAFVSEADRLGELALRAAPQWDLAAPALNVVPPPLAAQPPTSEPSDVQSRREYPSIWPFGTPRTS